MPDAERSIKRADALDRLVRVQENLHDPRDHDEKENENVIPFQAPSDRFEFADFE